MQVRSFRLLSEGHFVQLYAMLEATLANWAAAWGVNDQQVPGISIDHAFAFRAGLPVDACWRQEWSGTNGDVWCDWASDVLAEIEQLVFPGDGVYAPHTCPTPIVQAGAESAFDDLLVALRQTCTGAGTTHSLLRTPPSDNFCRGSGVVCVTVSLGAVYLRLMLSDACVRALLGTAAADPRPKLDKVILGKALESTVVQLTVRAGDVELGAATLLSIGVGDVIMLPLGLDAPLSLALPDGLEVCKGFIGRRGNDLVVEIANKSN